MAAVIAMLLVVSGCGDVEVKSKDGKASKDTSEKTPTPTPDEVDTSAAEGNWVLGVTSAGGADGETNSTVYVTYNPSTGQASSRRVPGVKAGTTTPAQAPLLVSADRAWAIPDTTIPRAQERSGKLKVYSLSGDTSKIVDIRDRTGKEDVAPIAWAFDPKRADTLRVVDTKSRVWVVDVAGGKARKESTLPTDPWVFTNGFNPNTGKPWVESMTSEKTRPAGNGTNFKAPVARQGGEVLANGSAGLSKLPPSPCRVGAAYTAPDGVTWAFCSDEPTVKTYYLPKDGKEWTAYGKPSTAVAPAASGFPLVLPPVSG